jgi:large subunit ribosomal protein L21
VFAIVESGGKQYRVSEGEVLRLEALAAEPGEVVELPVKLLVGDEVEVGRPRLENVSIKAKVLAHGRASKLYIYKFKAKSNYRRKNGHRQAYTEVRIGEIAGKGQAKKAEPSEERTPPAKQEADSQSAPQAE